MITIYASDDKQGRELITIEVPESTLEKPAVQELIQRLISGKREINIAH